MGTATTNGDRTPLAVHDWMGHSTPPNAVMEATDELVTAEIQFHDGSIEIGELNTRRAEWRGIVVNSDASSRELAEIAERASTLARRSDERLADIDAVLCVLGATAKGLIDRVADQVSNPEQSDRVRKMLADFYTGCEQQLPKCKNRIESLRATTKELSDRAHASIGGGS